MKNLLLFTLASAVAVTASANSKINPAGRLFIDDYVRQVASGDLKSALGTTAQVPVVKVIVIVDQDRSAKDVLSAFDVEVLSDINGVAVVNCPITLLESVAALDEVQQVGFGEELRPDLDFARPASNVSSVQTGFTYEGARHSFDGTGVVAGMMDIGLEANHLNFKNTDGTSRVKRLWHMTGNNGVSNEYTDDNVASFDTDSRTETHGTHVAGIMGGSYRGTGRFLKLTTPSGNSGNYQASAAIPFYGVATGADLALNCGRLSTPNIIQAVTNVIEYAESVGKPCVINLSLGSNTGPHDGSDYYSQALARLGTRGIICISAGNEGNDNISITKTLTASGNNRYLRTYPSTQSIGAAVVDMWTGSDTPMPAGWYIRQAGQDIPLVVVTGAGQAVSSANVDRFNELFNGTIVVQSAIDPNNGRYNVYSTIQNFSRKSTNTTANIYFQAGGDGFSGEKIFLFGTGLTFSNRASSGGALTAGFSNGSPSNSINDAACADNVISVGAYTSRTTWGVPPTSVYYYPETLGYAVGQISPFSSWGESFDGRALPLVCAPGANIISSVSRFYVANTNSANDMSASAGSGNITDYWAAMQGTSMSCPYVSGVVALWLQACPTLTYDQVMDVINHTSVFDQATMSGGRWGAGKIDALEGVKYILSNLASVGEVWADDDRRLIVDVAEGSCTVTLAGEASFEVTLHDIQGRAVARAHGADGSASVETSSLRSGVYVLTVNGASASLSRKVVLR